MLSIKGIHHIAIICTDYQRSKTFYTSVLGFEVVAEHYRDQRESWKCDLSLNGRYMIELFSFPHPPPRPSRPESAGLRHLAFEVSDISATVAYLQQRDVAVEPVRVDEYTGKRFTFIADPDGLPLEFYET